MGSVGLKTVLHNLTKFISEALPTTLYFGLIINNSCFHFRGRQKCMFHFAKKKKRVAESKMCAYE